MKALIVAAVALAGTAQAAEIIIYKQPNFGGEQLTLRDASGNLGARFTDQASSAVVRSGRWELCTQPNFQGDCVTLGPGEYSTLDSRLLHRVESARAITGAVASFTKTSISAFGSLVPVTASGD